MSTKSKSAKPSKKSSRPPRGGDPAVDLHVGQRVRARRLELGMSQNELARLIGITFQQLQKNERGVNRLSASRLYETARVLDVPTGYFFEGISGAKTLALPLKKSEPQPSPTRPPSARRLNWCAPITTSRIASCVSRWSARCALLHVLMRAARSMIARNAAGRA